jgi:hypothetical protein
MKTKVNIDLSFPIARKSDRFFTLRLKQDMYNEPAEYKMPSKMLVISDIEGNFVALLKLLLYNNVIDKYLKWTFGEGHLVLVGDCFDRGEQVVECLWLIYSLEEKAKRDGGYVHFILGNHEIMNLNGDWRYVHPKYAPNERSKASHTALYSGNNEIWKWLQTKNIVEKIGDILFVHGGIASELIQYKPSVHELNNRARPYYARANEVFDNQLLLTIFNSNSSPFWYRGYYQQGYSEDQIDAILEHFCVNTIITGHTIVEKITTRFNGKLINVDTDHVAGNSEALLIRNGKFFRVFNKRKKERIK